MKEQFQLQQADSVERETVGIRPGNVLVPVRDYNTLNHLKWVLEHTDTREQDVVVMTARISQFGSAAYGLSTEQMFSDYEQTLFTRAVSVAESFGKKVSLLLVPARDPWSAVAQTAHNLDSSTVVAGLSSKTTAAEQAFLLGSAWESIPEPKKQFVLQIVQPGSIVDTFRIGPHTPTMKNEDVILLHRLWLNVTREPGLENVHHHDILTQALTRFARDFSAHDHEEIVKELRRHGVRSIPSPSAASPIRLTPSSLDQFAPNAPMDLVTTDILTTHLPAWRSDDPERDLLMQSRACPPALPHLRRIHIRGLLIVRMNGPIFFRIKRTVIAVHLLGRHGEHEPLVIGSLMARTEAGRVISAVSSGRHALGKRSRSCQRLQ